MTYDEALAWRRDAISDGWTEGGWSASSVLDHPALFVLRRPGYRALVVADARRGWGRVTLLCEGKRKAELHDPYDSRNFQ